MFFHIIFSIFLFQPTINYPVDLLSIVVALSVELSSFFCLPQKPVDLWPYLHSSCKYPWRNLSCCYLFIYHLMVKPCILIIFLVYYFHQDLSSKTNEFIYWDPFSPYWRYTHYRILVKVFTLQVRRKTHVPSFNPNIHYPFQEYQWKG